MLRMVSANLNKRLGSPAARSAVIEWLRARDARVVLAQEPWKPHGRPPVDLAEYRPVGGDGSLHVWSREDVGQPRTEMVEPFLQRVDLDWLTLLNVYLDASSRQVRRGQLEALNDFVTGLDGRPAVVCGDFNIAPRPVDGLFDGRESAFNDATDREPLTRLLSTARLIDTLAASPPRFTIERDLGRGWSRFRCDLALVSDLLVDDVRVEQDDEPRTKPGAFTDHSALVVDLPVDMPAASSVQDVLFTFADEPSPHAADRPSRPHLTAMTRGDVSPVARMVVERVAPRFAISTLLDHGCGRGSDLDFYRDHGIEAYGWDPHPGFGFSDEPESQCDLVVHAFVLNVLEDPWQRVTALRHAAGFAKPGGHVLVATRSPKDIAAAATRGSWTTHHDGFWSSEDKGTFQKGISRREIELIGLRARLEPETADPPSLDYSPQTQLVLLRKP